MLTNLESETARRIREHYDKTAFLQNKIILYNAIGDMMGEEGKYLRSQVRLAMDAGLGNLYLAQLSGLSSDAGTRAVTLLEQECGMSSAMAAHIIEWFNVLTGISINVPAAKENGDIPQNGMGTSGGSAQTPAPKKVNAGEEIVPKEPVPKKAFSLGGKGIIALLLGVVLLVAAVIWLMSTQMNKPASAPIDAPTVTPTATPTSTPTATPTVTPTSTPPVTSPQISRNVYLSGANYEIGSCTVGDFIAGGWQFHWSNPVNRDMANKGYTYYNDNDSSIRVTNSASYGFPINLEMDGEVLLVNAILGAKSDALYDCIVRSAESYHTGDSYNGAVIGGRFDSQAAFWNEFEKYFVKEHILWRYEKNDVRIDINVKNSTQLIDSIGVSVITAR